MTKHIGGTTRSSRMLPQFCRITIVACIVVSGTRLTFEEVEADRREQTVAVCCSREQGQDKERRLRSANCSAPRSCSLVSTDRTYRNCQPAAERCLAYSLRCCAIRCRRHTILSIPPLALLVRYVRWLSLFANSTKLRT